jgi:GT2 family glycosyltransferase
MLVKTTGTTGKNQCVGGPGLAVAHHAPAPATLPLEAGPLAPVTVVIVNHNAGHVLIDCLKSALSQATEVVLVDNASRPDRFEPLIAHLESHPRLHLIRSAKNRGFAGGCNLGAELSTQPLVLFLNPDCVVGDQSLARLIAAIQEQPRAGMAGGLLTYPDGGEQGGGRRAVPTPWRSFVRAFGLSRLSRRWPTLFDDFHLHRQPLPPEPIAVEAISGACMLVKRDAIDDFGLMDEGYFLHCEDLDLCMRARDHGWQILFVPDAPIVHHKGGCSQERPIFVEWHKHRGMVRFYRKHFRHQYPAGLMELVTIGVWLRFAAIAARKQTAVIWQRVRAPRTPAVWATRSAVDHTPLDAAVMPVIVSNRPLTS